MTLASAVSAYGASLKSKLSNPAITGAPEDQLRGPLESLLHDLAGLAGFKPEALALVGETSLAGTGTRPDFAVSVRKALVGFIEVKAPGKGADPRRFGNPHDKAQWQKLKALPNLLYTDGASFSLWRDGEPVGKPVHFEGDLETAGAGLEAPDGLVLLIADFLNWKPIPPANAKQLAQVSARLCRLLRDEVTEELDRKNNALASLAKDWRKLLFPDASNERFADGYAQAVTFGLLVARAMDIELADGIHEAARELRKSNSLIGTALGLLTDDEENHKALKTSLDTLARVLNEVNWHTISKDKPEAWLYFYEHFLEVYDNDLRKMTGSYYTPPEVVSAMTRLVDETLKGPLFSRPAGLASSDVTLADPAVGTGTFLLGVMRRIAATVEEEQGPGAVRGAIEAAMGRLIGFELQFGPFAVAQLRLIAELQALAKPGAGAAKLPDLQLFITDTLGNPFVEEDTLVQSGPIAKSRRDANTIKKSRDITVVLGNPPYKEKARGMGSWIESGSAEPDLVAPMDWWSPPPEWGVSAHAKHLKNLYVYFWRWATWKVFSSGNRAATGNPDRDEEGIICFITVAGFLGGPGFQKMRADLRRSCSNIWVVDCSPDGHQPEVATRIFQGVQQPVCIVLAAKPLDKNPEEPAQVLFTALPKGRREDKFKALEMLSLRGKQWNAAPSGWRAPFFPAATGDWATFPALKDFFLYDGSGVMPGRTWVIAPDAQSLRDRWDRLIAEKDAAKKEVLFHPQLREGKVASRHIRKVVTQDLGTQVSRPIPIIEDSGPVEPAVRYPFRSFDRQWIIGDARLINDVRPQLWATTSSRQVYLTAPDDRSPTNGPAVSLTDLVPDLHHYNGRGGRVFPLWADATATRPNISPDMLALLADAYGEVSPEDVMAYLAAVMAHPAFTQKFLPDLVQPGLRVPLTADPALFAEAATLGREVIWLHTYGERFADAEAGRPKGPPRMAEGQRPAVPADGAIPGAPEPLPDTLAYDASKRRLIIGGGHVDNVSPEMWNYEVSGKQVVWHWFSYRRRDRTRPQIGDRRPPSPLDKIQPNHWLAEYTSDLIDLLNVLGRLVELEPRQANLLERILAGEKIEAPPAKAD